VDVCPLASNSPRKLDAANFDTDLRDSTLMANLAEELYNNYTSPNTEQVKKGPMKKRAKLARRKTSDNLMPQMKPETLDKKKKKMNRFQTTFLGMGSSDEASVQSESMSNDIGSDAEHQSPERSRPNKGVSLMIHRRPIENSFGSDSVCPTPVRNQSRSDISQVLMATKEVRHTSSESIAISADFERQQIMKNIQRNKRSIFDRKYKLPEERSCSSSSHRQEGDSSFSSNSRSI